MLYTTISKNQHGDTLVKYTDASHDWDKAWMKCESESQPGETLIVLVPGRHEVITSEGRKSERQ